MPGTWKKLVFTDDVPNIGNANLTIPASANRTLSLAGAGGFDVLNSSGNALLELSPTAAVLGNVTDTLAIGLYMPNTQMAMINSTRAVTFSETNNFRIVSELDSALPGPVFTLTRERGADGGTDNDEIGKIEFKGDNVGGTSIEYASVKTKIIAADDEYSDIIFSNKVKGVDKTIVFTKDGEYAGANADTQTENESKLKAIEVRTTPLETLTRRTQMVFQCGYNGVIASPASNTAVTNQVLRMSNGVQAIDGGDYTNSTGIVMPFDGYISGGSWGCIRNGGSPTYSDTGRITFLLQKYAVSGADDDWELEVAKNNSTSGEHPVSNVFSIGADEIRSDDVKVAKGDIIIPFIKVQTLSNPAKSYRIDDVIAQFVVYTESTHQG